jgi:hypothetical protein
LGVIVLLRYFLKKCIPCLCSKKLRTLDFLALVIDRYFMRLPVKLSSIVFFVAFILNANLSVAQIKFGPKTGLSFSDIPENTKYIIGNQHIYSGYQIGAIAELRIFKQFFIQPGVLLTTKGSKYVVGNNPGNLTTGFSNFEFSSMNADIPLNLLYKIDLGVTKLLLIAGPQFGYGLKGKWKTTYGISSNVHFGNGPENDFKTSDYGLNFGGGIEAGRFQISSQYYMGLSSLSTLNPPLRGQKYKILNISVAYLFGTDQKKQKKYKIRYLSKERQPKLNIKPHKRLNLK